MWPFKYPYTDFHQLNLDWILDRMKQLDEKVTSGTEEIREETEKLFREYLEKYLSYVPNKHPSQLFMNADDFGLVADGVTDNADALETAMLYCLNHNIGLAFNAGTYYVGRNIVIEERKTTYDDFSLIMQGCGQGTIIEGGSFTLAGNNHYIIANMQFKFTGEKGIVLGSENNFANRCLFINCILEGNPTALTMVYCNAVRFIGCRFSSRPEYIVQPSAMYPVTEYANNATPVNSIAFLACHFEGTKSGGVFVYKPNGTRAAYGIAYYACHFETRNLGSRIFYIYNGNVWTFDACVMVVDAYTESSSITDSNPQVNNYANGVLNMSIIRTLFDLKRTSSPPVAELHACAFCTLSGRYQNATGNYVKYTGGGGSDTLEIEIYTSSTKYLIQKRTDADVGEGNKDITP